MIAFCGHGRSGKDTAAFMFSKLTGLKYAGSASWVCKGIVADALEIPEQTAWETRHKRRMEWYNILNDFRKDDPTKLVRMCLEKAKVITGIRDKIELKSCIERGYISYAVWVERPGISADPTLTYKAEDCTHILENSGDLNLLNLQVSLLAEKLQLIKKS
jgi:hypothetical protein